MADRTDFEIPQPVILQETQKFLEDEHADNNTPENLENSSLFPNPAETRYGEIIPLQPDAFKKIQEAAGYVQDSFDTIFDPVIAGLDVLDLVNQTIVGYESPLDSILQQIQTGVNEIIDGIGGNGNIWAMYKLPVNLETVRQGLKFENPIKIPQAWKTGTGINEKTATQYSNEEDREYAKTPEQRSDFHGNFFNRRDVKELMQFFTDSFDISGKDPSLVPKIDNNQFVGGLSVLFFAPSADLIIKEINKLLFLFSLPNKAEVEPGATPDTITLAPVIKPKFQTEKPPIHLTWNRYGYPHKLNLKITAKDLSTNKSTNTEIPIDNTSSNARYNGVIIGGKDDKSNKADQPTAGDASVVDLSMPDTPNPNSVNNANTKYIMLHLDTPTAEFNTEYRFNIELKVTKTILESLNSQITADKWFNKKAESLNTNDVDDPSYATIASDSKKLITPVKENYSGFVKRLIPTFGDGRWVGGDLANFLPELEEVKTYLKNYVDQLFNSIVPPTTTIENLLNAYKKRVENVISVTENIQNQVTDIINKLTLDFTEIGFVKLIDFAEGGQSRFIREVLDFRGIDKLTLENASYVGGFWIMIGGGMDPTIRFTYDLIKSFFSQDDSDGIPEELSRDSAHVKDKIDEDVQAMLDLADNFFERNGILAHTKAQEVVG